MHVRVALNLVNCRWADFYIASHATCSTDRVDQYEAVLFQGLQAAGQVASPNTVLVSEPRSGQTNQGEGQTTRYVKIIVPRDLSRLCLDAMLQVQTLLMRHNKPINNCRSQ